MVNHLRYTLSTAIAWSLWTQYPHDLPPQSWRPRWSGLWVGAECATRHRQWWSLLTLSCVNQYEKGWTQRGEHEHSKNIAVKLMHMFPSQRFESRLTATGMSCVSNSRTSRRIPACVRKPTMIFGTPRRNDCIQNFNNFRWNFFWSWGFRISAEVLSSTQLMGLSFWSGLQSQTSHFEQHSVRLQGVHNVRASTSPPSIRRDLPMPVFTTEQYCAWLSTIASSRSSMTSLGVECHWLGSTDSVSNLYLRMVSLVICSVAYADPQ